MTSLSDNEEDVRCKTPEKEDCCGNGCNPCIFDIHKKLCEEWKQKKINKRKTPPDKNYLALIKYNAFTVSDIANASEDCIFIRLDCKSENKNDLIFLSPTQHVMIKLQTTSKPYTPISWTDRSMQFLIKLYPNGKASNCIKQLKIGDDLFIRGPYGEFQYQRNNYEHIVMFSIGTGIAAIYPLAVNIVKDELEDTRIKMVSAFRSYHHIPLKNELKLLADYWNFELTFYFSQKSEANITNINIVNSRLNKELISEILEPYNTESSLILICGTPEFNESVEQIITSKCFLHYYIFK